MGPLACCADSQVQNRLCIEFAGCESYGIETEGGDVLLNGNLDLALGCGRAGARENDLTSCGSVECLFG